MALLKGWEQGKSIVEKPSLKIQNYLLKLYCLKLRFM